jgi:hypothetical protein
MLNLKCIQKAHPKPAFPLPLQATNFWQRLTYVLLFGSSPRGSVHMHIHQILSLEDDCHVCVYLSFIQLNNLTLYICGWFIWSDFDWTDLGSLKVNPLSKQLTQATSRLRSIPRHLSWMNKSCLWYVIILSCRFYLRWRCSWSYCYTPRLCTLVGSIAK